MMAKIVYSLLPMCFVFLLAACGDKQEVTKIKDGGSGHSNDKKIKIVTTIAQIGEPLSVIGGELVEVKSLMGPSVDPHLYQATHGDIRTISDADIVFYNGLHLEANMVDIFKEMAKTKPVLGIGDKIEDSSLLKDENNAVDPHIWFDIDLWKQALAAAVEEIKEFSPENADDLEKNKEAYFAEMDQLKKEAAKLADIPKERRVLVTAHDAFGYFGRMHGLEVVGLQGLSTDGEIGVSDIQNTIDLITEYKVPAVFVESSINESSIQAVIKGARSKGVEVALGGELFSDAMGEAGKEEGTYLGMYRHNVDTIYQALMGGNQ
ncbi:metal ABC transporter solute-binding protein, Zn/Mn family [Neobacillus niacini]|uniref:metal ABC transporter solute-binding protein, Zn/Mn family n=1 Tax=Neobacillus niacini TaxID=86668 RepID=UPI0021CB4D41|nr:zinc ABC transporter substrate-binding protein [Neobacillus niacini]MCM3767261.1 zinc ABC transporter substrate-binding protein [Neobacillus niacini]